MTETNNIATRMLVAISKRLFGKTISCESKFKITKIPDVMPSAFAVFRRLIKLVCIFFLYKFLGYFI